MNTHKGSCHCGEVQYEVDMDIEELMSCNCSICSRRGHLLAFTSEDNFRLRQGEDVLRDYQFGSGNIHHLFCSNCGVNSFGRGSMPDGTLMVAINARCLENFDWRAVPVKEVDGASF
ncbi:GFA family protein [Gilvimarinus sp. F26214L]|uniref:GFA family protein n=1 Tax=Gilvimarinus sp. DZF01 TaxID=3461371 RepID=UPI0040467B0E